MLLSFVVNIAGVIMKAILFFITLTVLAPCAYAADAFCDTGRIHPIDAQFKREMDKSNGITVNMRNAQGTAYVSWDRELNRVYKELMAILSVDEKLRLRDAQRAWLTFRDAETKFWWSESISDGGTLQPVVVADHNIELLKARVCQLYKYKKVARSTNHS